MTGATLPPNPYIGPRAFQTGEVLYGRDRELLRLLNLLISRRLVLLHAPSGAGKTSLINAVLIPRLQAEGFRAGRRRTSAALCGFAAVREHFWGRTHRQRPRGRAGPSRRKLCGFA